MRKKILFVLPDFKFGGTVFSTYNMAKLLDKNKYDITIFSMNDRGPAKFLYRDFSIINTDIILCSLMGNIKDNNTYKQKATYILIKVFSRILSFFNISLIEKYSKYKCNSIQKETKYDYIVACQEFIPTFFVSLFDNTVKKIAWFRNEYKYYLERAGNKAIERDKLIYSKFNAIVCVSKITKHGFVSYLPEFKDKTYAIHNIQDVNEIILKSKEKIDDFQLNKNSFTIISIGRIDPQKRFSYIPKIISHIKQQTNTKINWYILGEGNVFGEREKLFNEIKKYDVSNDLYYLGGKINPYPYIANADLLVSTSYVEACPRVIIESKILKTPVICANFTSATEFIEDGVDGFISPIDDIHNKIINLINNPRCYNRIKLKCEQYNFDSKSINIKLDQLFTI